MIAFEPDVPFRPVHEAAEANVTLALPREVTHAEIAESLAYACSTGTSPQQMTSSVQAHLPGPDLVARTIAELIGRPRREVVVPRVHYTIAWLEQAFPSVADLAHRKRNWARLEEMRATW